MTGKRRSGRELAFRLLFQADVGGLPLDEVFALARESSESSTESWEFATGLARGAWERRKELDPHIKRYAAGWTLDRMANADRNLLRMALYEMLYRADIPQSVSINEAVELSKRYSTQESARFINGILGSYVRDHGKKEDPPQGNAASESALEENTSEESTPEESTTETLSHGEEEKEERSNAEEEE